MTEQNDNNKNEPPLVNDDTDAAAAAAYVLKEDDVEGTTLTKTYPREEGREYVSIPDDVYNLFLCTEIGSHACYYSAYIFILKIVLYIVLAVDSYEDMKYQKSYDSLVLLAQFLMIPIAVAMQDDLISSFFLIANVEYCKSIENKNPHATPGKWNVAVACRLIDGVIGLLVNYMIMIFQDSVLHLFLQFAAIKFLQNVDDIAVDLAAQGFFSDKLEEEAASVKEAELPKRRGTHWVRELDTALISSTTVVLLVGWFFMGFLHML